MEVVDGTSINTSHLASTWRAKVKAKESIKKKRCKERRGSENYKRNTIAIKNQICNHTCVKYIRTHLLRLCWGWFSLKNSIYLLVLDILSFRLTHFSLVFPIHSLQIHCFGPKSFFLRLSPKTSPYKNYPWISYSNKGPCRIVVASMHCYWKHLWFTIYTIMILCNFGLTCLCFSYS